MATNIHPAERASPMSRNTLAEDTHSGAAHLDDRIALRSFALTEADGVVGHVGALIESYVDASVD